MEALDQRADREERCAHLDSERSRQAIPCHHTPIVIAQDDSGPGGGGPMEECFATAIEGVTIDQGKNRAHREDLEERSSLESSEG